MPKVPQATLYVLYDNNDEIAYIGSTDNPVRRLFEHQARQPWWSDIKRAEFFHFDTLEEAREREAAAISAVGPYANTAHNRGPLDRPPSTTAPYRP